MTAIRPPCPPSAASAPARAHTATRVPIDSSTVALELDERRRRRHRTPARRRTTHRRTGRRPDRTDPPRPGATRCSWARSSPVVRPGISSISPRRARSPTSARYRQRSASRHRPARRCASASLRQSVGSRRRSTITPPSSSAATSSSSSGSSTARRAGALGDPPGDDHQHHDQADDQRRPQRSVSRFSPDGRGRRRAPLVRRPQRDGGARRVVGHQLARRGAHGLGVLGHRAQWVTRRHAHDPCSVGQRMTPGPNARSAASTRSIPSACTRSWM